MYVLGDTPPTEALELADDATLEDALLASALWRSIKDREGLRVAIFGQLCALSQPLCAGDRIEILRPLVIDPKEARRRRVAVRASKKR
jgi:putative ubiquitin-RnfH superfamily antitoxin RatB of RatAB toxin-antitoxin module